MRDCDCWPLIVTELLNASDKLLYRDRLQLLSTHSPIKKALNEIGNNTGTTVNHENVLKVSDVCIIYSAGRYNYVCHKIKFFWHDLYKNTCSYSRKWIAPPRVQSILTQAVGKQGHL